MIVVAGEALVDLVIDRQGKVTASLGGAPFNTARACGRLGSDVAFLGAISVDRFGSLLAGQLDADGVATDLVVRTESPTTLAAAELNEHGTASYRFYIQGTSAPALSSPPQGLACDVLFTGGLGLVLEPLADAVEALVGDVAGRALVMIDVNCRPLIVPDRDAYVARVHRVVRNANVVKVSDEDLEYLAPVVDPLDAARALVDLGPTAVLVTAGGGAVHVVTADDAVTVPVTPVPVVDTIGAGDSFGGGFLSWWVASGCSIADIACTDRLVAAVEAANAVAGLVCQRRGADPPWRAELPPDWAP